MVNICIVYAYKRPNSVRSCKFDTRFLFNLSCVQSDPRRGLWRSKELPTARESPGEREPLAGGAFAVHNCGKAQHFTFTKQVDWATPRDATNLNVSCWKKRAFNRNGLLEFVGKRIATWWGHESLHQRDAKPNVTIPPFLSSCYLVPTVHCTGLIFYISTLGTSAVKLHIKC